jgi:hypothetical protein
MCIMEVRPGQQDATIAQAMAHNVNTVVGDLEMFETVLRHRALHESADRRLDTDAALGQVTYARAELHKIYAGLLGLFGAEVGRAAEHWLADDTHGHVHAPIVGGERVIPGTAGAAMLGGLHVHGPEHQSAEPVHVTSLVQVADRAVRVGRRFETR